MSLTPNFELTPRESFFAAATDNTARVYVRGASLYPKLNATYRFCFDQQHAQDEVFFYNGSAGDPALDYTAWTNLMGVPHVEVFLDLSSYGAQKELALVFGFDAFTESRVLIFSNAGQLGDETLSVGDNQFLMEVESLETALTLLFIHVNRAGSTSGGHWFFRGITGYVI